jgi:hypothetical protein
MGVCRKRSTTRVPAALSISSGVMSTVVAVSAPPVPATARDNAAAEAASGRSAITTASYCPKQK